MILKKVGIFAVAALLAAVSVADTLDIQENHPAKYVVQKGDTLWDISGKFLKKPWYWPKIWNVNPQINDPHWIYPGDVLTLVWIDGKPYLQKAVQAAKTKPIPTIDAQKIKTYLRNDTILPASDDELAKIPYVLGDSDGRRLMAKTDKLYIHGGSLSKGQQYGIYHKGSQLKDESGKVLGYRAILVGGTMVGDTVKPGMTESLQVKSLSAVMPGDYVLPYNDDNGYDLYFVPKAATVDTIVVDLGTPDNDQTYAGKYDTVILGKGSRDGVSTGDVFSLKRPGIQVTGTEADSLEYYDFASSYDKLTASKDDQLLPDDFVGQAMVYRTYDHVSYALIMTSNKAVRKGYKAVRP